MDGLCSLLRNLLASHTAPYLLDFVRMTLRSLALAGIALALVAVIVACGGGSGSGGNEGIDAGLEISDPPCRPADAFVRMSDGRVGCSEVDDTYVETICGAGSRVVFDFADPDAERDANFTVSCSPLEESLEDVLARVDG